MTIKELILRTRRRVTPLHGIVIGILVMAALLAVMLYFDTDGQVLKLLEWLESQGGWALLWFAVIMVLVVVLLAPGVLFTTGAGFVFGLSKGTLGVVVGTTVGAAIAFLIARHLFGARTRRRFLSNPRMHAINQAMTAHGFTIVLLTRLVPFFPSKLANYFFGLTQVSLRDFVYASALGFIPFSLHNVYLGSIAADIATLGSRNSERTPLEWSLYGAGFLATIGVVLYLNRLAGRALANRLENSKKMEDKACRG